MRLALCRVDCFMYPIIEDWARGQGSVRVLSQAIIHFSLVDVYRMYSLFIRAAHHLIDVYNAPDHGKVQDKLTFYAMCKEMGLPCAAPLGPEEIKALTQKDMPLFAGSPRTSRRPWAPRRSTGATTPTSRKPWTSPRTGSSRRS